jgi:hypothetical protein
MFVKWLERSKIYHKEDMMNRLFVSQTELKEQKAIEALSEAIGQKATARMCHMAVGKWIRNDVVLYELADSGIVIQTLNGHTAHLEKLQIHQPVGISFQIDHKKHIFDSIILGFESTFATGGGRILIEIPEVIEKMPRRSYERQPVPSNLNVQALFWHRGYSDDTVHVSVESYWQGQLINLSAGGCQIAVPLVILDCFQPNQLIGLQFTPMFYQKPILVEAQIIHLRPEETEKKAYLGVEFLGLEVSIGGRTILHRLMDVVEEYAKLNIASVESTQPSLL